MLCAQRHQRTTAAEAHTMRSMSTAAASRAPWARDDAAGGEHACKKKTHSCTHTGTRAHARTCAHARAHATGMGVRTDAARGPGLPTLPRAPAAAPPPPPSPIFILQQCAQHTSEKGSGWTAVTDGVVGGETQPTDRRSHNRLARGQRTHRWQTKLPHTWIAHPPKMHARTADAPRMQRLTHHADTTTTTADAHMTHTRTLACTCTNEPWHPAP
jgi:hypothetical protein